MKYVYQALHISEYFWFLFMSLFIADNFYQMNVV